MCKENTKMLGMVLYDFNSGNWEAERQVDLRV